MDVYAVEQRTGDLTQVALDDPRRAAALARGIAVKSARTCVQVAIGVLSASTDRLPGGLILETKGSNRNDCLLPLNQKKRGLQASRAHCRRAVLIFAGLLQGERSSIRQNSMLPGDRVNRIQRNLIRLSGAIELAGRIPFYIPTKPEKVRLKWCGNVRCIAKRALPVIYGGTDVQLGRMQKARRCLCGDRTSR